MHRLVVGLAALLVLTGPGCGREASVGPEGGPERVERGRYLTHAVAQCFLCHSPRDWSQHGGPVVDGMLGAGAVFSEGDGYRMVAPNLTPDVETGAGSWSDDMLARAIREGIGHDGRALNPAMPYPSFRRLADEDVTAIVVYLRTLPAVRNVLPARLVDAERQSGYELEAVPLREPVLPPDPEDPLERAAYLMEIADCVGCHTNWYGDLNPGMWAGGNWIERWSIPQDQHAFSANLTPSPSGIPYYDEDLFVRAMRTGYVVARPLRGSMPWRSFAQMTDEDLGLIFRALRTLRPIDHVVDNELPPSMCPLCGSEHGGGERNRPRPPAVQVPAALLAEYAGTYRFDDGFTVELSVRGDLLGSDETGPLYALEENLFHIDPLGILIRFERDASGRVIGLVTLELLPARAQRVEDV